jgi:hypothetical protein
MVSLCLAYSIRLNTNLIAGNSAAYSPFRHGEVFEHQAVREGHPRKGLRHGSTEDRKKMDHRERAEEYAFDIENEGLRNSHQRVRRDGKDRPLLAHQYAIFGALVGIAAVPEGIALWRFIAGSLRTSTAESKRKVEDWLPGNPLHHGERGNTDRDLASVHNAAAKESRKRGSAR